MDALQSGHFRSEATGVIVGELPDWSPREFEFVTYGDFQAPDRSSYTIEATFWAFTTTQNVITIGVHGYVHVAQGDYWYYDTSAAGSLGSRDHLGDVDLRLPEEVIALFTLVGVQDLDGVPVYYITGDIPDSAARTILGEMPKHGESDNAKVEIWIGANDFLLHKLQLQQVAWDQDLDADLATTTVVTFSDFGKAVDIVPPPSGNESSNDDHGNDPGKSTAILVDQTIDGTIGEDYDPDYFTFHAEEGKGYLIQVTRGTLDESAFYITPAISFAEAVDIATDEPETREIRWVAPLSRSYFIVVQSRSGYSTGTYSLSLSEVDPSLVPFDHPSSWEAATPLAIGGRAEGSGNYEHDIDMFSFMGEEGAAYHIELTPREATGVGFRVYAPSGSNDQENAAARVGTAGRPA